MEVLIVFRLLFPVAIGIKKHQIWWLIKGVDEVTACYWKHCNVCRGGFYWLCTNKIWVQGKIRLCTQESYMVVLVVASYWSKTGKWTKNCSHRSNSSKLRSPVEDGQNNGLTKRLRRQKDMDIRLIQKRTNHINNIMNK